MTDRSVGGRPPVGPVIQVRLPEQLLAELDTLAERCATSRAEIIRAAVTRGLRVPASDGEALGWPAALDVHARATQAREEQT